MKNERSRRSRDSAGHDNITVQIVLLNGVGSSGKSSIAKALQSLTREPFLHLGLDTFIAMMPPRAFMGADGLTFDMVQENGRSIVAAIRSGALFESVMQGMLHAIAAIAAQGNNVIVDDVMLVDRTAEYMRLLSPFRLLRVSVFAPLEILEQRELARGDRAIGLARWQFDRVHHAIRYDLEVDTAKHSPKECAEQIVAKFGL
jgi:chloramphenicol 3-O phosphotransferase